MLTCPWLRLAVRIAALLAAVAWAWARKAPTWTSQAPGALAAAGAGSSAGAALGALFGGGAPRAVVGLEQMVVVGLDVAGEHEAARAEVRVVLREVVDQRAAEQRHVARGRHLAGVRQSGRVLEVGAAHAERARALGHHLGETLLAAREPLGEHHRGIVGRLGDDAEHGVLDANRRPRLEAELGRRHRSSVLADRQPMLELQAVLPQR